MVAEHGRLPVTPEVETGVAQSLLLCVAEAVTVPKQTMTLMPGLEIKTGTHSSVAPPSSHVSARTYAWREGRSLDEVASQPMPDWLITMTTKAKVAVNYRPVRTVA